MKIKCCTCKETKQSDQFYRSKETSTGHDKRCKKCRAANSHQQNRYKRRRVLANKFKLLDYMADKRCVDCGFDDPVALQFDHVRGSKTMAISEMISRKVSWESLLEELEKCDIRCANCHQKKSAKDLGWYRDRLVTES